MKCNNNNNNNTNNHGSTALYGLGPPLASSFSRLLSRVHSWQLVTGQLAALPFLSILMCPPEPSGRQSGDVVEKWRQFGLRNIFIHARKVLLHAVNLRHGTDDRSSSGGMSQLLVLKTRTHIVLSIGRNICRGFN
jgi:hypothetical protein